MLGEHDPQGRTGEAGERRIDKRRVLMRVDYGRSVCARRRGHLAAEARPEAGLTAERGDRDALRFEIRGPRARFVEAADGRRQSAVQAPRELEAHLRLRDPQWAAAITGAPIETIEEFARLIGESKRAFFRLGYGFSRSRNGPVNMHAASCIPAVTGAWQYEGGGAFHISADIFRLDKTLIEGLDVWDHSVRMLDQSRIGAILTGERKALHGGAPVTAMIWLVECVG